MVAVPAHGTLLQLDIASTFTTIGQRVTIQGPNQQPVLADGTDLDDTLVQMIIAGLVDAGEVTLEIHFDPADTTHKLLHNKLHSQTADSDWKIIFADAGATVWAFSGPISGFEGPSNVQSDSTVRATLTIKINDITLPA